MRLGELTAAIPKGAGRPPKNSSSRGEEISTKAEALERVQINRNQASQYELMAANPEIVEQAKAEARENDDIVLREGEALKRPIRITLYV